MKHSFSFRCLALCLLNDLEKIRLVYPAVFMIVIGHSLLYKDKDGAA
jgi:hypothetical protein